VGEAVGPHTSRAAAERRVGTWTLISVVSVGADGTGCEGLGPDPARLLISNAHGRMSVQIMRSGRPRSCEGGRVGGTAAENTSAVQGTIASLGRYALDETEETVTHHIARCLSPHWDGMDRTRCFTQIEDALTLETPPIPPGGPAGRQSPGEEADTVMRGEAVVDSPYLNPEIETAQRDWLRRLQAERFLEQVEHSYRNSPFYKRKFDAAKITPRDIRSLDDIEKIPFTTKDELKESQAQHPLWGDFLALPLEECLRVHQTSATTGRPVLYLDTPSDWHGFYYQYARTLYAYGVRKHDMVMAAFSYGPWIGFWSGFYAAQELGCLVLPVGGLSTEQRIDALLNYPITVLGCTPSYALYMAEQAAKKGIDLATAARIRITWHTGEPGASIPATKQRIEAAYGAKCFDLPGLTEIAPWGFECAAQSGQTHVHEDYEYAEILDQETGRPVRPGETGELVFTSLYRKAMPLLRYRTRDLVRPATKACPCGRTLLGLDGGVLGRLDDMKKIRGVIVYPRRIEEIVRQQPDVEEFYVVLRRVSGLDDILVQIDPAPSLASGGRAALQEKLAHDLQIGLGVRASVEVVEPGSLPRWDHKAKRVRDERAEVPF
jgi:phenylacetate-CoA ligase